MKKDKKEGSISFPINQEAKEIFRRLRLADIASFEGYVFVSRFGRHLAEASVWEAWNLGRKRVGHAFAPYEADTHQPQNFIESSMVT